MTESTEPSAEAETATTGHSWDGIQELDNPLPRWWLWSFIATIVWCFVYWIIMPSWPLITGYTEGVAGYSSRAEFNREMTEISRSRAPAISALIARDLSEIANDPELAPFAIAGGRANFSLHCSQCHGSGAAGAPGYPNLNDDDWIWGGTIEDIYESIRFGIRADHDETRMNTMPGFIIHGMLSVPQTFMLTDYVEAFGPGGVALEARDPEGRALYEENCEVCHGPNGEGDPSMGSPRINDALWLYGASRDEIFRQIANPRHGVMPAWEGRLDDATIRQLAVYVHSLGGGE